MSILMQVQSVSKYFTSEPILEEVSFDIGASEHVALIGPNGAGKTTLLKILTGELDPDAGAVQLAGSASLGILRQRHHLPEGQTIWQVGQQAMQPVLDLLDQANELAIRISEANLAPDRRALEAKFDQLQDEINQRDGYQVEHRIHRVLSGLGFPESDFDRDIGQLSGGQLNRLMLAGLLLEEPSLMLLDEPSNHLDIDATEWLEDFLRQSRQAFLLVSHDRFFLDRVCNQTVELVHAHIDKYPGNYSKYLELKQQRLDVERRSYEKQRLEIEKLKDFIRRNHHGLKHAQAEDRRKKLERIELVKPPREIRSSPMKFAAASRSGDIVLRCQDAAKSFGTQKLFADLSFQIERGQRWGILGPNGCGKSTLLRCLLSQESLDQGTVQTGEGVDIGYFDQHLTGIADDQVVAESIRPTHKEMIDQERRDLLAVFGITGDAALQKVASLSGGERNRVALAFLAAQDANFLILDEPTNHLDLWARQTLETAIKHFGGTVLMVSHDRYFINQLCDHLIVFESGKLQVFAGNYDAYRWMKRGDEHLAPTGLTGEKNRKSGKDSASKAASPNSVNKRKRVYPYRKLDEIESEIQQHEKRVEELHFELSNPEVLRDASQVKLVKNELADISDSLTQLYEHWEESMELN